MCAVVCGNVVSDAYTTLTLNNSAKFVRHQLNLVRNCVICAHTSTIYFFFFFPCGAFSPLLRSFALLTVKYNCDLNFHKLKKGGKKVEAPEKKVIFELIFHAACSNWLYYIYIYKRIKAPLTIHSVLQSHTH